MNYCTFEGDYGCSKELDGKCLSSGYCKFQTNSNITMKLDQEKIFQHFGLDTQIEKLLEEYREVVMAFLYGDDEDRKEELADLKNLVEQLTEHYGREEIERIQEFKNDRTLDRIESGYYD